VPHLRLAEIVGLNVGDVFANQSRRRISKRRVQHAWSGWVAAAGGVRPQLRLPWLETFGDFVHVRDDPRPVLGSEVCTACLAADDNGVHAPE